MKIKDKFGEILCKCGHSLNDHDYKVKEGVVIFGECKKCACKEFEHDKQ